MRDLTVFALSIGTINIQTGKTQYDWSIYDNNSNIELALSGCGRLMYGVKGTFIVGDSLTIRNNDTQRKLQSVIISAILPCNKEELIEKLLEHGYDYRTLRAFYKKKFSRKLSVSYSVKGVTNTSDYKK